MGMGGMHEQTDEKYNEEVLLFSMGLSGLLSEKYFTSDGDVEMRGLSGLNPLFIFFSFSRG